MPKIVLFFFIIFLFNSSYANLTIVEDKKPALVYNVDKGGGGIGNQLFQYACAYNLAKKHNFNLFHSLDKQKMANRSFENASRDYILDFFHVPKVKFLADQQIQIIRYLYIKEVDIMQNIIPDYIPNDKIFFLNDYCESEAFFEDSKEEIKDFFKVKEDKISDMVSGLSESQQMAYKNFKNNIESTESVCVHVRRGDTTYYSYWTLPITYQIQAMEMINARLNKPKFYMFSDDIKDVKKNIEQSFDMTFVSEFNFPNIVDFYLMTRCKHNIVTNSTFSWWAGYLNSNPEKIVVAPLPRYQDQWYEDIHKDPREAKHKKNLYTNFAYPKDWLTINPFDNKS